jgi:hypothetical protein
MVAKEQEPVLPELADGDAKELDCAAGERCRQRQPHGGGGGTRGPRLALARNGVRVGWLVDQVDPRERSLPIVEIEP